MTDIRLVMFIQSALILMVVSTLYRNSFGDNFLKEYRDLIPTEVLKHLKNITETEKSVLEELTNNFKKTNEVELITMLKEKSPSLYEKVAKLRTFGNVRLNALGEKAKIFINKIIDESRQLHRDLLAGKRPPFPELKEKALAQLTAFEALSAEAKDQLKAQFPILTGIFQNKKIRAAFRNVFGV